MASSKRELVERRRKALANDRATWMDAWRDQNDYILPRRGRFLEEQPNDGAKKQQKIIDGHGSFAARHAASGIHSGMTSPARPWFRLTTKDEDLDEFGPVKVWLFNVQQRMEQVFAQSNVYRVLHSLYEELVVFGTGAMIVLDDLESVIRCIHVPIGSYYVGNGANGMAEVFYRDTSLTVAQMVEMFGTDGVSASVRNDYREGNTERWVKVGHAIEPNDDRIEIDAFGARDMPYRSLWWERGQDERNFLRESGFEELPVMVTRWTTNGEDAYGHGLGHEALPDVKQLQHQAKMKHYLVDKAADPPVNADANAQKSVNQMPGGVTPVVTGGIGGAQPIHEVDPNAIRFAMEDIQDLRQQISRGFHEDLFLLLAASDRREITAREVEEKHEEKLLQLGPVVERVQNELLKPLIDRTFNLMVESGLLLALPPPPELEGRELDVEYISILAQAQKAVGVGAIERVLNNAIALAPVKPDVLDAVDFDEAIQISAQMLGVPPTVIRTDEAIQQIRQARAQQEAAAQRLAAANEAATAAKTASETDVGEGENLLQRITELTESGQIDPSALARFGGEPQ